MGALDADGDSRAPLSLPLSSRLTHSHTIHTLATLHAPPNVRRVCSIQNIHLLCFCPSCVSICVPVCASACVQVRRVCELARRIVAVVQQLLAGGTASSHPVLKGG